jgi:hypothetical protein
LSCSSSKITDKNEILNTGSQLSKSTEYFLSMLPTWANFSTKGNCYRSSELQFLNFSKVHSSYSLNHQEITNIQVLLNLKLIKSAALKVLTLEDRMAFFLESYEEHNSGVRFLELPKYSNFTLIWLDSIALERREVMLRNLVSKGRFDESIPVLFSLCEDRLAIEKFLMESGLDSEFIYLVGSESSTIYTEEIKVSTSFFTNLKGLIPEGAILKYIKGEQGQNPPIEIDASILLK